MGKIYDTVDIVPTRADADKNGNVLAYRLGQWMLLKYKDCSVWNAVCWASLPKEPSDQRQKKYEKYFCLFQRPLIAKHCEPEPEENPTK